MMVDIDTVCENVPSDMIFQSVLDNGNVSAVRGSLAEGT